MLLFAFVVDEIMTNVGQAIEGHWLKEFSKQDSSQGQTIENVLFVKRCFI